MDLNSLDAKRAERYRLAAYIFFFLSLAVLLVGLVPAMYYGSGIAVLLSLVAAAALFFLAFFAGGVGWSRFETPGMAAPEAKMRPEFPDDLAGRNPKPPVVAPEEPVTPYEPPRPTDENPPP